MTVAVRTADERERTMSFQAYLDTIEQKTGLTPRQFISMAHERGLDEPSVKAGQIVEWLKEDYGLGRGHAMALVHVIKNGATISDKHVGTSGAHSDESDTLWLDGASNRP
jgi:Domain of unknown function (DUF4287)